MLMNRRQQVDNKLHDCENSEGTASVQSTYKGTYVFELFCHNG